MNTPIIEERTRHIMIEAANKVSSEEDDIYSNPMIKSMKLCEKRSDMSAVMAKRMEYLNPAAKIPCVTFPMKKPDSQD